MRLLSSFVLGAMILAAGGCQDRKAIDHPPHAQEHESWAVTAWGDRYEIFAEADPLTVGETSKSHTHVTILDGFPPLKVGTVDAVLRNERGEEQVFRQETALRDGIYSIEIKPTVAGTFDLFFRVESAAGPENIPAGRVVVGAKGNHGGLVEAPRYGPPGLADSSMVVGDISFLKEQQWRTAFATEWAGVSSVNHSVGGLGRIRPVAGGEAILSAPLDGVVAEPLRAFVGQAVDNGMVIVQLRPRVGSDRSVTQIRSELELATSRLGRLEELVGFEAVSPSEVEAARARVQTLASELTALAGEGPTVDVRAPFRARIAEVLVVPGQSVAAGAALIRIVREEPVWVEVALRPVDASALDQGIAGLVLRPAGLSDAIHLDASRVRLVSRAPEVSRTTGFVTAIFELSTVGPLRPGMTVDAEILLPEEIPGIVVPASAVVDDGGVPVVYVQVDGESFARVEVRVAVSQGNRLLVEGPPVSSRIVTVGGSAIRRSALLQTGPPEGHVH